MNQNVLWLAKHDVAETNGQKFKKIGLLESTAWAENLFKLLSLNTSPCAVAGNQVGIAVRCFREHDDQDMRPIDGRAIGITL